MWFLLGTHPHPFFFFWLHPAVYESSPGRGGDNAQSLTLCPHPANPDLDRALGAGWMGAGMGVEVSLWKSEFLELGCKVGNEALPSSLSFHCPGLQALTGPFPTHAGLDPSSKKAPPS